MKLDARRVLLIALIAASAGYHGLRASRTFTELLNPGAFPEAPFHLRFPSPIVDRVSEGAAAEGLAPGDRIVTVGGRPLIGYGDLGLAISAGARTERLRVEVAREQGLLPLDLPMPRPGSTRPGVGQIAGAVILELVLPVFFLATGFVVVWFKPREKSAWLLLFMMETFSNIGTSGPSFEKFGPGLGTACALWLSFFASSWALAMPAFAIAFPEPPPLDRRLPWLKWVLFVPLLAIALITAGINLSYANFEWGARVVALAPALGRPALFLTFAGVSVFFMVLSAKVRAPQNADTRRRLTILLTGASIAVGPAGVIALLAILTGQTFSEAAPDVVKFAAILTMLVFPLTLAYVVIVHKAMGLGVVVRQGLQYALAHRAVRAMQILMGFVVAWGLIDILSDPSSRRVDRVRWMALAVLFMVLFQRGANRFRDWIDRRFFREEVDAEEVLADLGDRVRTLTDRRDLLGTVSRTIGDALHVPHVAAFMRGEDGFVPAFATGFEGGSVNVEFGSASVLTCCVTALQKPQTVYLDDDRSWVRREKIPEAEALKLRDLRSEVLIPLRARNSVEGFLSLGPKASEAAYSPSDLRLLQSVAHQTALALDNARLVDQVAHEVARRERLTREIEIAREVQFTLLPQTPPRIDGLDLAGHCRPAAGIGGDYYDFIPMDEGRTIGLAIGDIAGKGIPAALLMAGLQAALRGQALAGSRDLARLMRNINRLIYESSPSNRYATFFYGELRGSVLAFVNAGHNAPMLLHADGSVERLEAGGPVVGLMEVAAFTEGSVTLRPGDVLLGYTDGVSECMNPRDEEWGEDEVLRVLRAHRDTPADTIVGHVMREADAFAAGAKQHDDMTLLVMKVA